jgi:hypothetical protein
LALVAVIVVVSVIFVGAGCGKKEAADKTTTETQVTATPTATPVVTTPAQTPIDLYGSWKTYTNDVHNYSFRYPDGAQIEILDQGHSPAEKECVQVSLTYGYVTFNAPGSEELCGRTGVGVYAETIEKEENITVGGKNYLINGREFVNPGNTLMDHNETFFFNLDDGTRIEFGSKNDASLAYADYVKERAELVKIIESYKKL